MLIKYLQPSYDDQTWKTLKNFHEKHGYLW